MNGLLEIRLPDEVMETLPAEESELIPFLSRYFDGVIDDYQADLQRDVRGVMGGPLSRYERATIKDFLIRRVGGARLKKKFDAARARETGDFEKLAAEK